MAQHLVVMEMLVEADDIDSARNIGWETLDCGAMDIDDVTEYLSVTVQEEE